MYKHLLFFFCWWISSSAGAELLRQHEAPSECSKKVSLVLVHGFNGSAETWRELLSLVEGDASLSCVDTYTFSYKTGYAPEQPNIDEVADMLRTELKTLAQTQELILAAHSMGGIVIKKAILQDTAEPQFTPKTRQVIFVASPHLGIRRPFALFGGRNSEQVKGLRKSNIRELQRQWSDTQTTPAYTAIAAKKDALVTHRSAKGKFEDAVVIEGDHVSVAHPKEEEHPTYQTLKKSLLEALL